MPVDALALASVSLTPEEYRRIAAVDLMQGVAQTFGARSGVHPAGTARVTIAGMTVTVQDLKGVVYVPSGTSGPYRVAMSSRTHTVPTADPTNPRKDIVYLRVWDHEADGDGLYQADTVYLVGAPAGSPVEPTLPAGKQVVKIATIDVPAASVTPTCTYNAPFVVSNGGVLPVRGTSERPTTGLYAGQCVYRQDTATFEIYNGSTWVTLGDPGSTSPPAVTPAADWTVTWGAASKRYNVVNAILTITRTGANIVSGADGNITDSQLGTLPAGWRPASAWSMVGGQGSSSGWEASIGTDGVMSLRSGAPSFTITAGWSARFVLAMVTP